MTRQSLCPCASGLQFGKCCGDIINTPRLARTARQLMRSRYSAYVTKDSGYLLASWHSSSRPKSLNFENQPVQWLGLEIHATDLGTETDTTGKVEFTATYLENGQVCRLHENSNFVREFGLWYYLSGETSIARERPARNSPCPCGSGKKFKRCCLRV